MRERLLVDRTVNFPVLSCIARKRAEGNTHGEAGGVRAGGGWAADELEMERVGFASDPSIGDVIKNHLDGVVGDFVVAKATRLGNIVDVHLAGGALVGLRSTNASVIGRGERRNEEQNPNQREQAGAVRELSLIHI